VEFFRARELVDTADTPESIDEFLGGPMTSGLEGIEEPAMPAEEDIVEPARGFGLTIESETLLVPFGLWAFEGAVLKRGHLAKKIPFSSCTPKSCSNPGSWRIGYERGMLVLWRGSTRGVTLQIGLFNRRREVSQATMLVGSRGHNLRNDRRDRG